jgi:ActR/RegA family two-component response regulator
MMSMLVVDDDATFCRVLARAMEGRGYAVTVAHDVPQAIASAERNPPRYAVVDLKMPGPSGLALVRRLRELDPHSRIVVLTGYASYRDRDRGHQGRRHALPLPSLRMPRDHRGIWTHRRRD